MWGADFHRAMLATAPGEKLLIRRRHVRIGPAVGWGFAQTPLGILTDFLAVSRGPTFRGRGEDGEGVREGVRPLP